MSSAATKRRTRSQPGTTRSTVSDLIMKAASATDARATVSLASLKKALKVGGYDVDRARISKAKRLVAKKYLVQVRGTGASSGSFKVNKNLSKPARKKGAQKRKNQVRRVQRTRVRTAAVTATGARKKAAKRSKKARKPTFGRPLTRSLRSATKK